MSDQTKRWIVRAIAVAGPALVAALKQLQVLKPEWTYLAIATSLLATVMAEYIPVPDKPTNPPVGTTLMLLALCFGVGVGASGCTKAQGAADLGLATCVLGVVEANWSNPDAMLGEAVVKCGALVPPLFSVDNGDEANAAQRYLMPIVDEAIRLVALEKGVSLTAPAADAGAP